MRVPRARSSLLLALGLCAACGPEPRPRPDPDAGAPRAVLPLPIESAPELGTGAAITQLGEGDTVPLTGHRLAIEAGDWVLSTKTSVAVVDADAGRLIAFGARGGPNGLVYLHATAFIGFDAAAIETPPVGRPHVEVVGGVLHVTSRLQTHPLTHHQWLALDGDTLHVLSRIDNDSDTRVLAITVGERVAWANTPTWLAGHGELLSGGSYGGAFLGRQGPGVSYAMCKRDGRLNVKSSRPSAPGFHRTHKTGERRVTVDPGARSPLRRIALTHDPLSVGGALMRLPCGSEPGQRDDSGAGEGVAPIHVDVPADARSFDVETAYCEPEAARAARLLRGPDPKAANEKANENLDAPPPEERRAAGPYVRYTTPERMVVPAPCARARLLRRGHRPGAWFDPRRDDDAGWKHPKRTPEHATLAWRVRRADDVLPAKIIVRGVKGTKSPDWGEDPRDGAAKNFLYTQHDGSIAVPPGTYEVSVYRGFEYTRHTEKITLAADETVTVKAKLEHVVDTTGWISADLHVHAMPSWDAPASLEERVRSLAGVGVEVAVATDHDAVTDYAPAIEQLGLEQHVASIVGDEVTTEEPALGHFNVFPLEAGTPPLRHRHVHPHDLFADARKRAHGGVLQVNHPRMGSIGYFELLHLDRGDVAAWVGRAGLADMSFDAIEVFNGDHYDDIGEVRWVLDDWFALLDAGLRHTATGNSDSHKVAYQDAGMPRNWVRATADQPAKFDERAFVDSIRQARVVVSSGPFVRFGVVDESGARRADIGDTIDAGSATFAVQVQAPPWIDVDTVDLVRRGHVIKRWRVKDNRTETIRLDETIEVTQRSGDWLVVIVSGGDKMKNTYRSGAKPFAFTNPIWVR